MENRSRHYYRGEDRTLSFPDILPSLRDVRQQTGGHGRGSGNRGNDARHRRHGMGEVQLTGEQGRRNNFLGLERGNVELPDSVRFHTSRNAHLATGVNADRLARFSFS